MKKTLLPVLALILVLCMPAVVAENALPSADAVTAQWLVESTTPVAILENVQIFSMHGSYTNTDNGDMEGMSVGTVFMKDGDIYRFNDSMTAAEDYSTTTYFSTDPDDPYLYMISDGGDAIMDLTDTYIDEYLNYSVLGYIEEGCTVDSVAEKDGFYIACVTIEEDGVTVSSDELTIDPVTGHVLRQVVVFPGMDASEGETCVYEYDYSGNVEIDYTPKTQNSLAGQAGA